MDQKRGNTKSDPPKPLEYAKPARSDSRKEESVGRVIQYVFGVVAFCIGLFFLFAATKFFGRTDSRDAILINLTFGVVLILLGTWHVFDGFREWRKPPVR